MFAEGKEIAKRKYLIVTKYLIIVLMKGFKWESVIGYNVHS